MRNRVIFRMGVVAMVFQCMVACKKQVYYNDQSGYASAKTQTNRKVRYILYGDQSVLGSDNSMVTFTLHMSNRQNRILWDSTLPAMRVKDVPSKFNPISIEKEVPVNDASVLKVGFIYILENIGTSNHLDTFGIGAKLKYLEFNFR